MDHLSRETVLVTGIDGFTGKHLAAYLKTKGFKVFGTALRSKDPDIFNLDINDISRLNNILNDLRPEYIIHLAAISFVGHISPVDFYNVNVIGTESILKVLLDINHYPKKILIPSSATVYGNQGVSVLDESMIPKPTNHYGCSKLAMERIATNYFEKIPILITRPFNYTGPGQSIDFLIPKIIAHFKDRKDIIELGNIDVRREFNSVDYICEIYFRLLMSNVHSQVLNVCSAKTYSIIDILDELEELTQHRIQVRVNQEFVRRNEIKELKGSLKLLSSYISIPELRPIGFTLQKMLSS